MSLLSDKNILIRKSVTFNNTQLLHSDLLFTPEGFPNLLIIVSTGMQSHVTSVKLNVAPCNSLQGAVAQT